MGQVGPIARNNLQSFELSKGHAGLGTTSQDSIHHSRTQWILIHYTSVCTCISWLASST